MATVLDKEHFTAALNLARSSQYTICAKALAVGPVKRKSVCREEADFASDCSLRL
jgi:hypothetical protein